MRNAFFFRVAGFAAVSAGFVLIAAAAAGQDTAPRRPPEPFRVFVHTSDAADAALEARLEEAVPMVRERVERRDKWFRLAASAEEADVVLRIVNYHNSHAHKWGWYEGPTVELVYVDAVATAGTAREELSGLDQRPALLRASLRNAASHLAEELERFAKDNYGALRQLRARATRW
jgi:hypothetical protein